MKKNNTVFTTIKSFSAYLGCIGISLFIMYYFSGAAGILLAVALSVALIMSLAVTLIVKHFVAAEAILDKSNLSKGESVNLNLRLHKNIILPSPPIGIKIKCSPHLFTDTNICYAVVAGTETNTIKIPLKAIHSGKASVYAEEIFITDFTGIFTFKIKKAIGIPCTLQAGIYPDIPDVPIQTDFLKTTAMYSSNDDEEETNETALASTGTPGYDHRTYYPGDPIKRINWKLSSKRDIYMIRLDEKTAGAGQVFFLDIPFTEDTDFLLSVRDNVIEGMLASFNMLVRENREIIFFYPNKGEWQRLDIHSQADVSLLQDELSDFEKSQTQNTIPPEIITLGKTPICFTAATADFSYSAVQIVSENHETLIIGAEISGLQRISPEMWMISPEFEIKKTMI